MAWKQLIYDSDLDAHEALPDVHHPRAHSDADHTGPNRVAVQDEGVAVGARATLNFTGAGVTASDDAPNDRVVINIPGGGGGGGGPHDHTSADGSGVLTGDEHDSFSEWYGLASPPAAPSAGRSRLFARTLSSPGNWQAPAWLDEQNRLWPLLDLYPVEAFGAKGDGSTDDTAAIQAAIDAAFDAGGGTVVFDAKTYRITDTLFVKSKVRLLGKGYQSILRQDTAGKHGVRAAPVARPPGFDARTSATGTNPHIGITIENLHFASGVDWTQPGKPTAGVAIYLSSSRMVFLHQIWIDGYPDYRTKRWAGGIWFDDVDPANIPCRHTSVLGFFIQSIGDDTEYAGDADGVTYPNRKVGHTGILLRMVNTGADGAPAWGHHFVNGVVQTEHATDSLEYYVGGQNAPGYRGFLNQGSEGVYLANAEFVDFVKVAEWNADADFSPSGLNKGRYESCVFEAPGFGEPAGRFRGPISQHEFWGCGFLGSGDPVFSGKSYGIDIDCATAAELWFLQCVFSAHAEGPDNTYAATQAIAIANSFGQLWQNRSPKFSECMITVHGTTFKNVPHGISATTGNVDGLGIVGCTFSGLNYAIRHSLLPGIQNNKSWTIIMNRFIDCTRTLMIASWSTTNTDLVIVGNSSPSGSSISVFFYAVASNTLMMNSRADMNLYRLRSMVSQGGLYVGNTSLSLLTEDSDGKIYPYYVWIVKGSYTTENTVQTLANYGFSGQAAQAGFFRYTCVISGANVGVYELTQGFRWNGTTLSLVGTVNKLQWETTPGLDASVAVSGEQLLFQVTPIGENPTTVEARIEMIPILRNP